jgi:hypothetical protein
MADVAVTRSRLTSVISLVLFFNESIPELTLFTYRITINLITINPIFLIANTRPTRVRKNRSLNLISTLLPLSLTNFLH